MTRSDPDRHHRSSVRLKGYDYAQAGAYFVTICAQDRACVFGSMVGNGMQVNDAGHMVVAVWDSLPTRFPGIDLDAFVVMPNHIHGIIVITDGAQSRAVATDNGNPVGAPLVGAHAYTTNAPATGATARVAPTTTLGAVVGAYKSLTTVEFVRGVKSLGWSPFPGKLWQRNYYEHIIRDEEALDRIRQYIADNPARWMEDPENPVRLPTESSVGAPLVGARSQDVATGNGNPVGAPLVDAQSPTGRATTRVAPTDTGKPR